MTDDPIFSEKFTNLKQPYCFIKVHWSVKFRKIEKETIVLISYQVGEAFCCFKDLYEMKNLSRGIGIIFFSN